MEFWLMIGLFIIGWVFYIILENVFSVIGTVIENVKQRPENRAKLLSNIEQGAKQLSESVDKAFGRVYKISLYPKDEYISSIIAFKFRVYIYLVLSLYKLIPKEQARSVVIYLKPLVECFNFDIENLIINSKVHKKHTSYILKYGDPYKYLEKNIISNMDAVEDKNVIDDITKSYNLLPLCISNAIEYDGLRIKFTPIKSPQTISDKESLDDLSNFCIEIGIEMGIIHSKKEWEDVIWANTRLPDTMVKLIENKILSGTTGKALYSIIEELTNNIYKNYNLNDKMVNIFLSNLKVNLYLLYYIELYKLHKNNIPMVAHALINSFYIVNLYERNVNGSEKAPLNYIQYALPQINYNVLTDENINFFMSTYKKGTTSMAIFKRSYELKQNSIRNKMKNSSPQDYALWKENIMLIEKIGEQVDELILLLAGYFAMFAKPVMEYNKAMNHFKDLIMINPFKSLSDEEIEAMLNDSVYYDMLSKQTIELYERFGI